MTKPLKTGNALSSFKKLVDEKTGLFVNYIKNPEEDFYLTEEPVNHPTGVCQIIMESASRNIKTLNLICVD